MRIRSRFGNRETWRNAAAAACLVVLTLAIAVVYGLEPQSPGDMLDRLALALDETAYGPNLRSGERLFAAALRAGAAGAAGAAGESRADALAWRAARAFDRAGAAAPGPRERLLANDRAADAYLMLGRWHLERGRGTGFGVGRHAGELGAAERVGACVVSVAPTRRRGQINAFIEDLEAVLGRPLAGSCPR